MYNKTFVDNVDLIIHETGLSQTINICLYILYHCIKWLNKIFIISDNKRVKQMLLYFIIYLLVLIQANMLLIVDSYLNAQYYYYCHCIMKFCPKERGKVNLSGENLYNPIFQRTSKPLSLTFACKNASILVMQWTHSFNTILLCRLFVKPRIHTKITIVYSNQFTYKKIYEKIGRFQSSVIDCYLLCLVGFLLHTCRRPFTIKMYTST